MMRKILLCLLVFAAAASTQLSGQAQSAKMTGSADRAGWFGKAAHSVSSTAGAFLKRGR